MVERMALSCLAASPPLRPPQPESRVARRLKQRKPERLAASCDPTPLIAAMRCFVPSSGELEVPKELL